MAMDWQKFVEQLLGTGLTHGLIFDLRGAILAQSTNFSSSSTALVKIVNEFNFCGPAPRPRVLTMVVLDGIQYFHARTTETSIQFTRADCGVGAISGYRTKEIAVIGINNESVANDDAFNLVNRAGHNLKKIANTVDGVPHSAYENFQSRNACR